MDVWGWLWIGWGLIFAAIEGTALLKGDVAGTLSDHLRLWFKTNTKAGRTIWLVVFGALAAVFAVHIGVAGVFL